MSQNKKKTKIQSLAQAYHPKLAAEVSRRQMLQSGVSLCGYSTMSSLFGSPFAQAQTYTVQRRLVWINMRGGWDILEITDPKPSSTSGIDMSYSWDLANQIAGGGTNDRVGRWLTRLASQQGQDMVVVRGLNMGTTSHMAGSVYMDTGLLDNTGQVNSASIPAIVASESAATIPIIQLNGGSDPLTDRGLLNPVSVVRAQNLDLYRSMYPDSDAALAQKLLILDHLNSSIASRQSIRGTNDRLSDLATAEAKVRVQFQNNVGAQLALTDTDTAPFAVAPPQNLDSGMTEAFALALKMLKNNLVSCVNLGMGGFDTHANQERSMQPRVESFDYLLSTFMNELRTAGQLDNTLIVVYSDFGRTPKINGRNGRDHWPFGGALMLGGGIAGGRVVGATDDDLRGLNINSTTGAIDSSGINLNPTHLCGSVLELTLGSSYLSLRNYLQSIPALTQVA